MAADKTLTLMIRADGTLAIKEMDKVSGAQDKLEKSQNKTTKSQSKATKGAKDYVKQQKGVGELTNNSTHAFSKMAQQMNGIVPVYATVAANVFAITAAFSALERAADFQILVDSADLLAVETGKSLTALAENMKDITGSAISMKEALTQASIAASAGFDNSTIEKLTQVARNASVALGREMTDSLNRVFKGAIKAEPELLDELGIILRLDTAATKYAATLGKTAKELTTFEKQQAVVNDVIEQGEKKFGRLSEVDPNPFTQLSAAFSEVTTSLVNLINTPISGFIGFFTENIASLTAAIILLATSVAKQALPAITAMGEGFIASFTNLGKAAKTADSQVQGFVKNLLKKVPAATTNINAKLEESFTKFSESAKAKPGIEKMLDRSIAPANRLNTAIRSIGQQIAGITRQAGRTGVITPQLAASRQALIDEQKELKGVSKQLGATTIRTNAYAAATSAMGKVVTATTGVIAVGAGTIAGMAVSMSLSAQSVSHSIGLFATLEAMLVQVIIAYAGVGKVMGTFQAASALAAGLGAGLLKLVPIISIATIAWQILGGAFTKIKKILGFEDIAKLSEKLDEQVDALDKSAASAANFDEKLKDLPDTLDSINEKLTLQANVLGGLSAELKKVNEAIAIDKGFGWWDTLLDAFDAGQLDTYKESLNKVIFHLDKLGLAENITDEMRDLSNSWVGGGENAEKYGIKLLKLLEDTQRYAEGAKTANKEIIDDITKLDKATNKLAGELPSLGGVDQVLISVANLSSKLDAKNMRAVVDSLSKMSSLTLGTLGLDDLSKEVTDYIISIDKLDQTTEVLNKVRENLTRPQHKQISLPALEESVAAVEAAKERAGELGAILAKRVNKELVRAVETFTELSNNARKLKEDLSLLSLDKLNAQNKSTDTLNILKEETQLKLKAIETENKAANAAMKVLSLADDELQNKRLAYKKSLRNLDKKQVTDEMSIRSELGVVEASLAVNRDKAAKLQLKLDKDRGKNAEVLSKLYSETTKEINKVVTRQAQGVSGLDTKYNELKSTLEETVAAIVRLTGKTDEWGDSLLSAQNFAEKTSRFLLETRIASNTELEKQIYNTESSVMVLQNEVDLVNQLGTALYNAADAQWQIADARLASQIAMAETNVEASFDTFDIHDEASVKAYDEDVRRVEFLRELRTAASEENRLNLTTTANQQINSLNNELEALDLKAKKGILFNKIDRDNLKIAKLRVKFANLEPKKLKELIKLQEKLNKVQRKNEYADSLRESAQSMNDLADSMNDFVKALGSSEIDNNVASMQLLQQVGQDIGETWGAAAEGLATLALSMDNYASQMKEVAAAKLEARDAGDGELTQTQLQNFALQEQGIMLTNAANAAGAMAGAFKDGSNAAKAFTVVQQGLALASAAVAVANAGSGDPYTAIARVAAMIAAMVGMLSTFGVGTSGGMSAEQGTKQVDDYNANIGEQGLIGRSLQSNTLVDGLDEIIRIDDLLYGETKKMVNSLAALEGSFSSLAVALSNTYGADLSDLPVGVSLEDFKTEDFLFGGISETFLDINKELDKLDITGLHGELRKLLGSTTKTTVDLIDKGLEFTAAINSVGASIQGELDTQIFSAVQFKETKERFLRSDKVTYWIETYFSDIDEGLTAAFQSTFNDVANSITRLIAEFSKSTSGIDLTDIFAPLEGLEFTEKLSLKGLDEEESAEALGAYFSALTDDIIEATLPFIEKYRGAGETLGDTLVRLTTDTIKLNQAFDLIGKNLSDYTDAIIPTFSQDDFRQTAFGDVGNQIVEDLIKGLVEGTLDEADVYNEAYRKVQLQDLFLPYTDYANAAKEATKALSLNIATAWNQALLEGFGGDVDIFNKTFQTFVEEIFSEQELIDFSKSSAVTSISSTFDDLIIQAEAMDRLDLADVLRSGGFNADTVELFYDLADSTNAFSQIGQDASGTLIQSGAELLATLVGIAPALAQLSEAEDVVDSLESLNEQYVQQIALFGLVGKELDLLALAFDFSDAMKEAEETGTDLALVEQAYGLERLAIIKQYYEEINDEIKSGMDSILESMIEVSRTSSMWDDVTFSIFKINKLVTQLKKGTNAIDLSSLTGNVEDFEDFAESFSDIIGSLSEEGPSNITEEIALVEELRAEILNKYELESSLIEDIADSYEQLSIDIQGWLNDVFISDLSPLTNAEQLTEASNQFFANLEDIQSDDPEVAALAIDDILSSATAYLEQASEFFAIGDEYQKIFDIVTSSLANVGVDFGDYVDDSSVQDKLDELNIDVINKLGVLDDILKALGGQAEDQLSIDIGQAVTEGLFPYIQNITDKLTEIDDNTWKPMIDILGTVSTPAIEDIVNVATTPDAIYDYSTTSGDVITTPIDLIDVPGLATGTPYVPEDMIAQIHQGETIIPESMSEGLRQGTLTLGEVQDNSDIVDAIKELTLVLATSQEDIIDATNDASQNMVNSMSTIRQAVNTSKVA